VNFAMLQVELAKVKQQKIPSGWAADSSGQVGIGSVLHAYDSVGMTALHLSIEIWSVFFHGLN